MDNDAAIRACRAGDMEAFRHLVDRYQSRALAHARLLTRNEADAADATQDAFVDAFRNLTAYDPDRQFYPWFYVLLPNRCFKQRSRRATRAESGVLPGTAVDPGVSEEQLDLWRAIGQLAPEEAEMVGQLTEYATLPKTFVLEEQRCRSICQDSATRRRPGPG